MSAIRYSVAALLVLTASQEDPALEALLGKLSADRVEDRAQAVEALSRLDPARLPELKERLKGLSPETRGRLAEAIRGIEDRVEVLHYLPVYRPVTLRLERRPARAALKELVDQSGLFIDLATCPEGHEVSVNIEQLSPLEALTAICKPALLGWHIQNRPDWRGRSMSQRPWRGIRIHEVVPYYYRPQPVAYVRHYRISAEMHETELGNGMKQESLGLRVEPAPGVSPHSVSSVTLTRALDENGRDLRSCLSPPSGGFRILRIGETKAGLSSTFSQPHPPAHRISRLSGTVTFRYPRRVEWVNFKPSEQGVRAAAMGCEFSLAGYSHKGANHEVTLEILFRDAVRPKIDPEMNLPFDYQEVEVVTESGERLWSNGCSGHGGQGGWTIALHMKGSKDEAAAEVRIPHAERFVEDVVDFELQDIPLDTPR